MIRVQEGVTNSDKEVLVYLGDEDAQLQPVTFRCCPLGLQFYSPTEIEEYKVMNIRLRIPDAQPKDEEVDCCGVVVHCERQAPSEMFRTWIYFIDLPQDLKETIHCITKDSDLQCPYCENF